MIDDDLYLEVNALLQGIVFQLQHLSSLCMDHDGQLFLFYIELLKKKENRPNKSKVTLKSMIFSYDV